MPRLIKSENMFGKFCKNVYTIEYQKCGLPHIHLSIFFNSANEFLETFHIDEVICAKLPVIETDQTGELTRIVTSVMLHSACRDINSYPSCISNA